MKNEIRDERIILSKRKIQSDGFMIVWLILLISVLVQQYLESPVSHYIVEMVIFISMSIYLLIFNMIKGNEVYPSNNKKSNTLIIIQSIFTGLVITIINTTQNYFRYGDVVEDTIVMHIISVAVVSFISATIGVFVVLKLLFYLSDKKQQKINSNLDIDE